MSVANNSTNNKISEHRWPGWVALIKVLRGFGLMGLLGMGVILVLLWLFAELVENILQNEATSLDNGVGLWIHSFANPSLDTFFYFFTALGSGLSILILTVITFGSLAWRKHFRSAWLVIMAMGGGILINQALKLFFQRSRPQLWTGPIERPDSFSFPSGHATIAFCFFGLLIWLSFKFVKRPLLKASWTVLLAVIIVLIGLSRIYLGVHYLTDVLGGYISGSLWLAVLLNGNGIYTRSHRPANVINSFDYTRFGSDTTKLLLINPAAGRARRDTQLEGLVNTAREQNDLGLHFMQPDDNLSQIVQQAIHQGVKVVGVAGGDGTINSVASFLVNTGVPLVVIPFGTLNHFARDIGVPTQPEEALLLFDEAHSQEQTIDVGQVNGHYFLNNSSVGLYPSLVRQREKYEKVLGKGLAYLLAAWDVLRHPQLMHIKLAMGRTGMEQDLKVGLVFISNNQIALSPLVAGQRARLDGEMLEVWVVQASSLLELIRVTASFLRNKLEESPMVVRTEVCDALIYTLEPHLRVACDGEVFDLSPPLNYRIKPASLLIRVPKVRKVS